MALELGEIRAAGRQEAEAVAGAEERAAPLIRPRDGAVGPALDPRPGDGVLETVRGVGEAAGAEEEDVGAVVGPDEGGGFHGALVGGARVVEEGCGGAGEGHVARGEGADLLEHDGGGDDGALFVEAGGAAAEGAVADAVAVDLVDDVCGVGCGVDEAGGVDGAPAGDRADQWRGSRGVGA